MTDLLIQGAQQFTHYVQPTYTVLAALEYIWADHDDTYMLFTYMNRTEVPLQHTPQLHKVGKKSYNTYIEHTRLFLLPWKMPVTAQ